MEDKDSSMIQDKSNKKKSRKHQQTNTSNQLKNQVKTISKQIHQTKLKPAQRIAVKEALKCIEVDAKKML